MEVKSIKNLNFLIESTVTSQADTNNKKQYILDTTNSSQPINEAVSSLSMKDLVNIKTPIDFSKKFTV